MDSQITRFHRSLVRSGSLIALLVIASVAGGCAGSRVVSHERETPPRALPEASSASLEQLLRAEVRTWEGTPHVWGGESRAGADCSGFVMRVYEDALGVSLPRTTEDQAREGRNVSARSLQPGDLVFFRTAPKTRHVGIYLSDGQFAHASSSAGVSVSDLDGDYWQNTYWMSRRVLPDDLRVAAVDQPRTIEPEEPLQDDPIERPPVGAAVASKQEPNRVGW